MEHVQQVCHVSRETDSKCDFNLRVEYSNNEKRVSFYSPLTGETGEGA